LAFPSDVAFCHLPLSAFYLIPSQNSLREKLNALEKQGSAMILQSHDSLESREASTRELAKSLPEIDAKLDTLFERHRLVEQILELLDQDRDVSA
jgi:hypothetical protein